LVPRYSLILLLVVSLIGCRPVQAPPTVVPVVESTATAEAPTAAPDSALLVRNAQYQLGIPDSLQVIQLQDGKYEQGTAGGADHISVLLTDFVATGDLDGDGVDEIAALISENFGGTGVFVFLAVYKMANGTATFLTSSVVDDRAQLNALSIADGEIFLDAVIHTLDDPMCCPTLRTTRHYRLVNDQLDMTDYTTFTPDGRPRTIIIESPANGTEIFTTVQVRGSVAIAPFENNLTYSIKDGAGVELSRGAVTVAAPDLGAPGTFDEQISIGSIISGTVVTIEIQDISAADGSLLAMDSVQLVVK
jgi:Immunoglobulin-like domain of bacterial spore germination